MINYKEAFVELKQEVRDAGLLQRVPKRGMFEMVLILVTYSAVFIFAKQLPAVVVGLMLAALFTRIVFISHDILHGQYFKAKTVNTRLGYFFASILIGLSGKWWDFKHNINHHTWTNCPAKDEDIMALDGTFTPNPGNSSVINSAPHFIFWSVLFFMYSAFIVQSFNFAIKRKNYLELFFMTLHFPLFYGGLFFMLDPISAIIAVLVMHFSLSFWLAMGFITNHLGCEVLNDEECTTMPWMELQLRTSRNVKGGMFIHWFFGGLNTQIEHHLYPKAPRFNLLKAAKITQNYCERHDIPYNNVSAIRAYIEIDQAITKSRG